MKKTDLPSYSEIKHNFVFNRVEASAYCRLSASTFYRIGPEPDISQGKIRLWHKDTLDKWIKSGVAK